MTKTNQTPTIADELTIGITVGIAIGFIVGFIVGFKSGTIVVIESQRQIGIEIGKK